MAAPIFASSDINKALKQSVHKKKNTRIEGLAGQDCVAVGLEGNVRINVVGEAGDFFGALNDGVTLIAQGNCGRFVGDNMISGRLIVHGNVGGGAASTMRGGFIVVRGNAESQAGQLMRGGTLVIQGNAGPLLGVGMTGGDILVTADTSDRFGHYMTGGSIFVNGETGEVGINVVQESLTRADKTKLTNYLTQLNISGQFKFKKYVAKGATPFRSIPGGSVYPPSQIAREE